MSIHNAKEMIEQKLVKIVDLFHTKLDSITSRTEQIKEEPVYEHIQMEFNPQNTLPNEPKRKLDSCSNEIFSKEK